MQKKFSRPSSLFRWLCIFAFSFFSEAVSSQNFYRYPIQNYTPKQYGTLQAPQNWSIVQNKEGLIYIGNDNGVLEYDGTKWNFIPVILGQKVFSLAVDSSNTIFVGSFGQFGFLEKNEKGTLSFVSLLDKVKEADRHFENIWRVFALKDKVYFQCTEAVFVYDYKTVSVIYPETSFHLALCANGKVYARDRQKGLVRFDDLKTTLVNKSEITAEYGLFSLLSDESAPGNVNRAMLVTQEKGLHWLDLSSGELTEIVTPDNDYLLRSRIYGGIRLPGNLFALNTEFSGTIVVNASGRIVRVINDQAGLQNNYVIAQCFDKTGNLWLALNNGISKVDWFSPLQKFDETAGLPGVINDAIFFEDKIYVASSDGLFIKTKESTRFIRHQGIKHVAKKILIHNKKLLLATEDGLFVFDKKTEKKVYNSSVSAVEFSGTLKKILLGTPEGLVLLDENYNEELIIPGMEGEIFGIAEGKTERDDAPAIWVSTQNGYAYVLNITGPLVKMNSFSANNGLPHDWIYPFSYNGKIHFGSNYGLLDLEGKSFDTVGVFDQAELFGQKFSKSFSVFSPNNKGDFYYAAENKIHLFKTREAKDISLPFIPIDLGKINSIRVVADEVFISCNEGLVVYNEKDNKNYAVSYPVILSRISTAADSVIFSGFNAGNFSIPGKLGYSFNKLSLEFSSSYFFEEKSNMYAYKLDGLDTAYSSWQKENTLNLNNLAHGKYTLWIKAKNIFGVESKPLSIEFEISPPWYRTTTAYISYGIGFIIILVLTAKASSYRVKKQKKILEDLVKQRTAEIELKNVELEARNEQIMHQKQEITDSINYAKRIQTAILPPVEEIQMTMKDIFVLFMPKDIVSGDFYWYHKLNDEEFLIGCADCTGHGVPGGFMSMVCSDKLNEAVKTHVRPSEILNFVNKAIKKSLRQDGGMGTSKDGMEISLLHVNALTKHVTYAGANRFMWIVRKGAEELEDIKPTKAGIGGSTENSQEFESHDFHFREGDIVYLSSDGFGDQFGGEKHKKLTTRRFKELLMTIRSHPFAQQHDELKNFILGWRADLEQIDDILVIGLKF
jgi:serine phosphatase RsbU (regulator of sigma subunit)/ligand-binding sensor domain-containing protein